MPCWVVPAVASEIWNVSVDHILQAVRSGQIPSKFEDGFTFIDVAPGASAIASPARPQPKPITYRVPKTQAPSDTIPMPRAAEIITPIEMQELHADQSTSDEGTAAMGDWRRGRRNASARRSPPRGERLSA